MNFFVTQVANFASIGIVKLLKEIDKIPINIIGCSHFPNGYTSGSILVDKCFHSPAVKDDMYLDFIINICITERIDCIISCDEDELILLKKNTKKLNTVCIIPSSNILHLFKDKLSATKHIQSIGVNTPTIINDLCSFSKGQLPIVIFRKRISVGSQGIEIVDLNNTEFIRNNFNDNFFIQEFVLGDEYTVDVFCDYNGIPKVIIPRLRLDIRNGISYKCQIIKNKEIIDACKKIYEQYKIPGLSNIQFKFLNNHCYFLELNPRFAGTGIASSLASFNVLDLFIDCFIFNKPLKSYNYYMNCVCWNSIITRYYEETIYIDKN